MKKVNISAKRGRSRKAPSLYCLTPKDGCGGFARPADSPAAPAATISLLVYFRTMRNGILVVGQMEVFTRHLDII